jgi:hypothetical protein
MAQSGEACVALSFTVPLWNARYAAVVPRSGEACVPHAERGNEELQSRLNQSQFIKLVYHLTHVLPHVRIVLDLELSGEQQREPIEVNGRMIRKDLKCRSLNQVEQVGIARSLV